MTARSFLLLFLLTLLAAPLLPSSQQAVGSMAVRMRTSGDTHISSSSPNANFGSAGELIVGTILIGAGTTTIRADAHALVNFNLFDKVPPGAEVISSKLLLTVKEPPSKQVRVEVRPLTKSFSEGSATWSSHRGSYGDVITAREILPSQGTQVEFDVTSYVREVVREGRPFYGFYLMSSGMPTAFFSKEGASNPAYAPTLSVSYRNPTIELVGESVLVLNQGQSRQANIQVTGTYRGRVSLSYEWIGNAPQGVWISFSPPNGRIAFVTTMEVRTAISASAGDYKLRIKAQNTEGDYVVVGMAEVDIKIRSASTPTTSPTTTSQPSGGALFTIDLRPDVLTVARGELAQFSVVVTRAQGFLGDIRLFAYGIPHGSTFNFLIDGQNVYLKVQTSQLTPVGSYTITVRGTGDGYEAQDTATLVVSEATQTTSSPQPAPSFSLSLSQGSIEVVRGGSASLTASVVGSGGFSSPVALSVSGLPSGVSISTDINNAPPNFTANLVVSASPNASIGSHSLSVIASGGGVTRAVPLRVIIREAPTTPTASPSPQPRISVSLSQASLSLKPGESASIVVAVDSNVPVRLYLSGAPADASHRFEPESLGGSGTSSLLLTTGSTTGTFNLLIKASGGGAEGFATLNLSIRPAEVTRTEVTTTPVAQLDPLLIAIIALSLVAVLLAALLLRRRGG